MSTILKALRRLEEDQPGANDDPTPGGDAPVDAESGIGATSGLRERILAEERANRPASSLDLEGDMSASSGEASEGAGLGPLIRRWGPLTALAVVVVILGVVVVPALFDSEVESPTETALANSPGSRETAPSPDGDAALARPVPRVAATPGPAPATETRAAETAARLATKPPAKRAPTPPAGRGADLPPSNDVAANAASDAPLSRRAAPAPRPAPTRTREHDAPVAVAELPVAKTPSRPPPAAPPVPTAEEAPAAELAFVTPTRTPPSSTSTSTPEPSPRPRATRQERAPSAVSAPATPKRERVKEGRVVDSTPKAAPREALKPRPAPRREAEPKTADRPVAKTSEAEPIERVTRPDVPDVTVLRTSWHPEPSRRAARIRVEASEEIMLLHEGDAIGALVIKEISPSAVLFEAGEVELRRRVGTGR